MYAGFCNSSPVTPSFKETHRIRQRIQLQIPPKYVREPVISRLASCYEVEVNILSALMATTAQESGWFDLELFATPDRIQQALAYLSDLHIEIWTGSSRNDEGWQFS
ncbi:MAG: ABC transporter [Acaryochloridaceae cyanobacterium RU_4_10]|nr:ABC transporter [Acaryochloridaceae cyanobacterium RU_4_10]